MRCATRIPRRDALAPPIAFSPRRAPVQRRSRDTVATILDAAARVFATHGYARGTTNRIAERAGVSIGSLYEYFPSKDAILAALAEAHVADIRAMLRDAVGGLTGGRADLETTVRAVVEVTVKLHAAAPTLHRVFYEESPRSPRIRAITADA